MITEKILAENLHVRDIFVYKDALYSIIHIQKENGHVNIFAKDMMLKESCYINLSNADYVTVVGLQMPAKDVEIGDTLVKHGSKVVDRWTSISFMLEDGTIINRHPNVKMEIGLKNV